MSSPATKSRKKGLDEDSFQKLLAAAFVVQEHNDRGKKLPQDELEDSTSDQSSDELNDIIVESRPAYAYVMEEIVATQHQIQTRRLELQQAMALIVERLLPIAHADGAAIALLEPDRVGDRLPRRRRAFFKISRTPHQDRGSSLLRECAQRSDAPVCKHRRRFPGRSEDLQ
jgi:hypothetical protein